MTKRKKEQVSCFAAGVLFVTGTHMAVEDYLGLERYVAFLRDQWIDLPWHAGAAGAFLGVAALLFWMRHPAKPETGVGGEKPASNGSIDSGGRGTPQP